MTPKEKAQELFGKFYYVIPSFELPIDNQVAKECALIAVYEIIELYEFHIVSNSYDKRVIDTINYFDEVKQEIEKL